MNSLTRGNRRRGLVLVVVLSCLAVLALIGVSFAVLSSLERTTSANYRITVQARLLARAGVEHAVSRLAGAQALSSALVDGGEWKYYGNDTSGFDPSERDVSLDTAKRPSYAIMASGGRVEQVRLRYDEKRILSVGVSGRMKGGEYFPEGNIYSLEVRDLSGCLYVNDGLKMQGGNRSSVSENLRRILNILGRESSIGVASLGDKIIDNRPGLGGYATWHHLATVLKKHGGLPDETIERLEKFLTVHGWTDTNVVNPVPFGPTTARFYPIRYERGLEAVYRRGSGKDHRNMHQATTSELGWLDGPDERSSVPGTTAAVYGLDELFPSYVEVVHRAPVNINTAPEEILVALLADLRGVYLMERRSGAPHDTSPGGIAYTHTQWITPEQVHTFQVPQFAYTWEYMGHTYSPDHWSPLQSVNENKPPSEPTGATTDHSAEVVGGPGGGAEDRDELGWLTATPSLNLAGGGKGSSARTVAREIMLCREAKGDYALLPFGGPFKTWAQFHAFCDHLARTTILSDDRFPEEHRRRQAAQALADVLKANFNPNFTPNEINPDRNLYLRVDKTDLIVNSTEFCFLPTGYFQINSIGRILAEDKEGKHGSPVHEIAAQAGARAVVQVHQLYRETTQRQFYRGDSPLSKDMRTNNAHTVESGPESDNGPLIYGDHFNTGQQKLSRELDGDAQYYERGYEIQSGWGYEASGYLALPTRGGPDAAEQAKDKYTMRSTVPAMQGKQPGDYGELSLEPRMHAHYRYDDRLHHNQSSQVQLAAGGDPRLFVENMASVLMSGSRQIIVRKTVYNPATCSSVLIEQYLNVAATEKSTNFPDPGEDNSGEEGAATYSPYDPTDGIRYRLVRSFRLPLEGKPSDRPPLTRVAPSDLRVDGMYVERHSGLAYWIDEEGSSPMPPAGPDGSAAYSFDTRKGVASFWFKPGFDPRFSGKVRTIASVSRFHRANYHYRNPSPFALYYFPAFQPGETEGLPVATQYTGSWPDVMMEPTELHRLLPIAGKTPGCLGLTQIARSSLVFQVAWGSFEGTGWDMETNVDPAAPMVPPQQGSTIQSIPPTAMERYAVSPTLNLSSNSFSDSDTDFLRARQWTHISMIWDNMASEAGDPYMAVAINGQLPVGSGQVYPSGLWTLYGSSIPPARPNFAVHSLWDHVDPQDPRWFLGPEDTPTGKSTVNVFRLGEVSTHSFRPFPRNFSSDGTYDEFSLFTEAANALNDVAKPLFEQGRYVINGGGSAESKWSSPPLKLEAATGWQLAKASAKGAPGSPATKDQASAPEKGNAENLPRLIGVSWTWYAERYALEGISTVQMLPPVVVDYKDPARPRAFMLSAPAVRIMVTPEGQPTYPVNDNAGYLNDGFSPITNQKGAPVTLERDGYFKYHAKFQYDLAMELSPTPNPGAPPPGPAPQPSPPQAPPVQDPPAPPDPPHTDPPAPPSGPPPPPPPMPQVPQSGTSSSSSWAPEYTAVLVSRTAPQQAPPPPPPPAPPPPMPPPPPKPGDPPPAGEPGAPPPGGMAPGDPVYLSTPILDDVTFYYQSDTPRYLELVITMDFGGKEVITDAGPPPAAKVPPPAPRPQVAQPPPKPPKKSPPPNFPTVPMPPPPAPPPMPPPPMPPPAPPAPPPAPPSTPPPPPPPPPAPPPPPPAPPPPPPFPPFPPPPPPPPPPAPMPPMPPPC